MQALFVKHRSPSMAAGMNILAPGLGLYYLGQPRDAWLLMILVVLPWFALLLFPWHLSAPLPLVVLPLLSVTLWLLTLIFGWHRARRQSPMVQHESQRWYRYTGFWLIFCGLCLLWLSLALVVKLQLSLHQVTDNAMSGTFKKYDWVVIAADIGQPDTLQHGDIVLLIDPETHREVLQRVVALPGEQVTVHGGGLFVNGEWQSEHYLDDLQNQKWIPEGVVHTTADRHQPFLMNQISGVNELFELLWRQAGRPDKSGWLINAGVARGRAMQQADKRGAYTLWGAGPFIRFSQQHRPDLEILVSADPLLQRVMAISRVNPEKVEGVNAAGAQLLQDYLLSAEVQAKVSQFRQPEYEGQLWWPAARHN